MRNISAQVRWISVFSSAKLEVFELWNEEVKLMSLSVNHSSQTAKIECDNSRRYFHLEKEGLLLNKTIFKNEYGIKIGETAHELWSNNEGSVEMNEERFHYTIRHTPVTHFTIYRRSKKTVLLTCALEREIDDKSSTGRLFQSEVNNTGKYACLLLALCWFLFMPVARENTEPFVMAQ